MVPEAVEDRVHGRRGGRAVDQERHVGYVLGYDVPLIIGAVNAFTMGCRSVNPNCEVRTVITNDYFNPPKTSQAVSTLLDAAPT